MIYVYVLTHHLQESQLFTHHLQGRVSCLPTTCVSYKRESSIYPPPESQLFTHHLFTHHHLRALQERVSYLHNTCKRDQTFTYWSHQRISLAYWSNWSFNEQNTSATPVGCPWTQPRDEFSPSPLVSPNPGLQTASRPAKPHALLRVTCGRRTTAVKRLAHRLKRGKRSGSPGSRGRSSRKKLSDGPPKRTKEAARWHASRFISLGSSK